LIFGVVQHNSTQYQAANVVIANIAHDGIVVGEYGSPEANQHHLADFSLQRPVPPVVTLVIAITAGQQAG